MTALDQVTLNFSPSSLMLLNVVLGVVMFGVALDLKVADFARLLKNPKAFFYGFVSQFFLLPALTLLLVLIVRPSPSIALGLILVAACPGGNISNFIVHRAGGNTALSVSLTAGATIFAIIMTPFNLAFWGDLYQPAASLVRSTSVSPLEMAGTVAILLLLPLALGMLVNARLPKLTERMRGPMRILSLFIFAVFVLAALAANWRYFLDYIGVVAGIVLLHNGLALAGGYWLAAAGGLNEADRRAVSIETGIQNSGLGLVLIFNFFNGLGGMAIVAAWWGVWHIVSGLLLAAWFRYRDTNNAVA